MSRESGVNAPGATVWPRRKRRRALGLGLLVAVGLAVWLVLFFNRPTVPTLPVPVPNGYDDLILTSNSIAGTPPKRPTQVVSNIPRVAGTDLVPDEPIANWDEAKAFLETNRETLALARAGLDRECVVTIAYVPGYLFTGSRNRKALLALAEVFLWEARLAVHEGRDADAARSFLDMVRLGHAVSRGGVESDYWIGNNIATGGLLGLVRVRGRLDAASCRRAAKVVGGLGRAREPYALCRERERAVQVAEQGQFLNTVARLANSRRIEQAKVFLDESVDELVAHERLVEVELALRAFEAEKGEPPASLASLVPSHLAELPLDPYTGKPPVYRRVGPGHLLYSVGPDRVDEKGAPLRRAPGARSTGNILLDSPGSTLAP